MEPNEHQRALTKAHKALAFMEQFQQVKRDLDELKTVLPRTYRSECEAISTKLGALLTVLDVGEEEIFKTITGASTEGVVRSKVERLRIGGEIIRLRTEVRMSYADIAERFAIATSTVSAFCKAYEQASPSEQARIRRTSIFDAGNQYEELGAMIYRQLARLETSGDAENHVKYISELRQTLKQAEQWMERISVNSKLEQIRGIVMEVLLDECPEKRTLIMQRFAAMGVRGQVATRELPA